ncbi:T9SS type A sorting domain-containing protein [Oceanihabitans sp.]|nr:T9SS type A sorting domain-containing protein [Oceanihabitans sp.]
MKKITLTTFLLISAMSYGQITLFADDFESQTDFVIDADIANWLTLDLDGLPTYTGGVDNPTYPNAGAIMAYQIFNPSTTTPAPVTNDATGASGETRNFDARSGDKYAACWAAVPGANPANDDWLISPVVTLGTEGNMVSFWVKAMSDTYGPENYTVGIYEGNGVPTASTDFTLLTTGVGTAPYPDWENVSFDLSAYNSMDIRIGIHCVSADRYMFMVDDFEISTTTLSVDDFDQAHNYVISFSDKLVTISSIVDEANYRIISISGQIVIEGKSNAETHVIDMSNLSSGIYIVEVTDGNEQRIQRKKIALQ